VVATEIDHSVADCWCGVEVALVVELAGEEVGDVGPGDGPADSVGAEEAAPNVSSRGPVAGARKRTRVQVRSELMMMFDMPTISS
jgi:hypothetical protein